MKKSRKKSKKSSFFHSRRVFLSLSPFFLSNDAVHSKRQKIPGGGITSRRKTVQKSDQQPALRQRGRSRPVSLRREKEKDALQSDSTSLRRFRHFGFGKIQNARLLAPGRRKGVRPLPLHATFRPRDRHGYALSKNR